MRFSMLLSMVANGEGYPNDLAIGIVFTQERTAGPKMAFWIVFFLLCSKQQVITVNAGHVSLDSTAVKVHPDGTGALKKTVRSLSANRGQAGQPKSIWSLLTHKRP